MTLDPGYLLAAAVTLALIVGLVLLLRAFSGEKRPVEPRRRDDVRRVRFDNDREEPQ